MRFNLIAAISVLALAACSSTPTVKEVADAAGTGSVALMKEANGSAGSLIETSTVTTLGQLIDRAQETGLAPSLRMLPSPVMQTALRTEPARLMSGTTPSVPTTSDVDAKADALGKFFRERIFTEANVESSSGDGLVFRIKGEDVCGDGVTPDPTCEASFDRYEVRIRVIRGMYGLNFYLELGPDRLEPLRFELASDRIAVGVNLGALKASLQYLDQVSGESHYLPKTMEGAFTVGLKKNGEQDFTLTSSVDAAIKLELDGDQGPASFSTEAKDPWIDVRVQAKNKQLAATLDLGVTDLSFPYSPNVSTSGQAGKTVSVHLAGASFDADLSESSVTVDVKNIGLGNGESYVALDGTHLLTVNLNPSSGRHFDLSVGMSIAGPAIHLSPEFDLTTAFFYQPLQVDSDVTLPPYGIDSTYHFVFNDGSPTLVPNVNGFKVTSGTLRLENTAHLDQAVVVATGRCLVKVTPVDGSDPLLGEYAAQDCP